MRKEETIEKGTRFGRFVTLGESKKIGSRIKEKCLCDCGNIRRVIRNNLKRGISKSCGCICKKHGMCNTVLYKRYFSIVNRCNNKNSDCYDDYGGRGIKCERNSFDEFYKDMSEGFFKMSKKYGEKNTTIDRIDVNGNYNKDNCRWATCKQQCNNRRSNRIIIYKGNKYTLQQLSELVGISRYTIYERLKRGRDINRACEESINK